MQLAVVDIETTGNNAAVDDIIQIGIILMEDNRVIERFDSYIYTDEMISPFIESLTGINNAMLEQAPTFSELAPRILELLENKVFVAHNISFDLNFLTQLFNKNNLSFNPRYTIDTVDLFKIFYPDQPSYQLSVIAAALDVPLDDAHSAIADAEATAALLIKCLDKAASLPKTTLIQLYHLAKRLKNDIDHLLFPLIEAHRSEDDLPEASGLKYIAADRSFVQGTFDGTLAQFYAAIIADNDLNYRKEQLYLTELIYDNLVTSQVKLIEAEVGSGKTLAYLTAAVYYVLTHKENVLFTTATKALQQQLIHADAAKIEKTLRQSLPLVLLKSKRNYISVEFVKFILADKKENHDILLLKMQLLVFLVAGQDGDIERMNLNGGRKIYFELMRNLYKPKQDTYLYQDVKTIAVPMLGVTNHSHLLHSGYEGFPKYFQHLIIDEGHQLQEVALNHTSTEWSYQNIKYNLSQLSKEDGLLFSNYRAVQTKLSIDSLMASHYELKEQIQEIERCNDLFFDDLSYDSSQPFTRLGAHLLLDDLVAKCMQFHLIIEQLPVSRIVKKQSRYVLQIYQQIKQAIDKGRLVFYNTSANKTTLTIYVKDRKLEELFSKQLISHFESLVLLSGSLLLDHSVAHLSPLLGHHEREIIAFNPMHRSDKVTFFIPDDVPVFNHRSTQGFIEQVILYITSYLATGHKKMLILFNNYQLIMEVEQYLEAMTDHVRLVQTPQSNPHKLLTQFNQLDSGILLGTQSFYEGLDYQSDAFKCVMIVSLPFIHPNDKRVMLMQDETGDSFDSYQLPYAATKVRQAAGRLIRNETDDGIILCMDRRIVEAHYHQVFDGVLDQYTVRRGRLDDFIDWIEKNKPVNNK
ncbi:helicase C-terminal domain-containing protein [Macrococcus equipercicus]|uniref:3'-5' exonuclease DinG n=1 Tax=Macrococcus equipercicus TaxID=69967 RepID=A0A9Q9F0H3_9STAP|nr:helicase C-terminal domain-containing protein [Macrococcus equipercicus]UTH12852.1 3'-5' exoribonuclease [Macrococcus equipercicus]